MQFNINICDLIIDSKIADIIEYLGYTFPIHLKPRLRIVGTFKLSEERLKCVLDGLFNDALPPIKITHDGIIVDGRHRVAAYIIKKYTTIPAIYV